VSNRKGSVSLKNPTCCDDIYYYKESEYVHLGVKGKTYELTDTKKSVDTLITSSITLSLVLLYDSVESREVTIKSILPEKNGDYFFDLEKGKEYTLKANAKDFYLQTYDISTKNIEKSDTIEKNFFMEKMSNHPIIIKNIYYQFDKFVLLDSSKTVIDTTMLNILNDNADIKVEIGSYTDSRGSDFYNQRLSQQRAQSVVNYLVGKGVKRSRLVAKGYGETNPIAPNINKNGSDNPNGRQMNRRTEFKIIGKIEGVSEIIYKR
jgi:outer membrane protein OmpA-like peptidoglycan-associated protein